MSKYERMARLLKIMVLIKARRAGLNRKELAELCGVSVRTIQRDIDTLAYAGIPVFWSNTGYEIMPEFFLPPVNLSLEEAFYLVVAAKAFSEDERSPQQRTIESAISKIIARLPNETRYRLEAILDKAGSEGKDSAQLLYESTRVLGTGVRE